MPGSTIIGRVSVKVVPDTREFRAKTKSELDGAAKGLKVKIPVELDFDKVAEDLRRSISLLQGYADANPVKIRTKLERTDLEAVRAELAEATRDRKVNINVDVDQGLADRLRGVTSGMSRLRGETNRTSRETRTLGSEWRRARREFTDVDRVVRNSGGALRTFAGRARVVSRSFRSWGDMGHTLEATGRRVGNFDNQLRRMTRSMERGLGRGSRNNFIHFFAGLATTLTTFPFRVATKIGSALGTLGSVIGVFRADGAAQGFQALGKALAPLMGNLIAFASVIAIIAVALPAIILLIGQLTAVLVSFAGAVTIGIIGALLPMVPIAAALGVGLGVVVGMFASMRKEGKWLPWVSKAFKGVATQVQLIKKDLTTGAKGLAPGLGTLANTVVGGIRSMVKSTIVVIGSLIDDLNKKFQNPRQQEFFKQWGKYLPTILESMGKAISSFGLGLVNFFVPVLPYAQRLADAIKRVADDFLDWTSSAKGQNSISDFMKHAWEDAKKLGSILGNITRAIANLFNMGSKDGGGDDILTWLDKVTKKFEDWTGSDDAKNYFKEAFDNISGLAKSVGKIFDDLRKAANDKQTKQNLKDIVGFFEGIAKLGGKIEKVYHFLSSIGVLTSKALLGPFGIIDGMIQKLTGFSIIDSIRVMWDSLIGSIKNFFTTITDAFANFSWSGLWEGLQTGAQNAWNGLWNAAKNFFGSLPGKILLLLVTLPGAIVLLLLSMIPGAQGALSDLGNAIGNWFRNTLPSIIRGALGSLGSIVGSLFSGLGAFVAGPLAVFGTIVGAAFKLLPSSIRNWLSGVGSTISDVFSNLPWLVSGPIHDFVDWVGRQFKMISDMIPQWLKDVPGKVRDVFMEAAKYVAPWASGIGSKLKEKLTEASKDAGSGATETMGEMLSGMVGVVKEKTSQVPPAAKSGLAGLGGVIDSTMTGATASAAAGADNLKGAFSGAWTGVLAGADAGLGPLSSILDGRFKDANSVAETSVSGLKSKVAGTSGYGGIPAASSGALAGLSTAVEAQFNSVGGAALMAVSAMQTQVTSRFSSMASVIPRALQGMGSGITNVFTRVAGAVGTSASRMASMFSAALSRIGSVSTAGASRMSSALQQGASRGASALGRLASLGVALIGQMASGMAGAAARGASSMVSSLARGASSALGVLSSMAARAANAVSGMGGALYGAGLNAMAGLRNGIVAGGNAAIAAARAVAAAVAAASRSALDIHSPSRVMKAIGVFVSQGLGLGIEYGASFAVNAVKSVSSSVADAMAGAFDMADQGKSAMQSLADGMVSGMRPVESAFGNVERLMGASDGFGVGVTTSVPDSYLNAPQDAAQSVSGVAGLDGLEMRITGLDTATLKVIKGNPIVVADATATGNQKSRNRKRN